MANSSIYAAFERMWQHIIAKIGTKADLIHAHDEYLTEYTETDPTVPAWAKAASKPTYTASEVGAAPAEHTHDVSGQINEHNIDKNAHTDIRTMFTGLASEQYVDTKVADLVNSAPEKLNTLDELAAALGDDENFANTVTEQIASKADNVDLEALRGEVDAVKDAKADWSQNDETAIDYVKNRTHWVEVSKEVVFEEQTVEYEQNGTYLNGMDNCDPNEATLIVTIDGAQYQCETWMRNGECAFGDSRLLEDDSNPENVPFAIVAWYYNDDYDGTGTITKHWYEWEIHFATTGSHTVKIELVNPEQSIYHTLDERYMPDTIARKSDFITETWTFTLEDGSTVTKAVYVG